ncbi:MAG: terminase large subunit domain-containing protein, partial [Minisyncoccia bacterium]
VDSADHLFLCGKTFIPTHNSTTVVAYLLHYIIFNDNVNIGILANKASISREILGRLQLSYENLPKWMQHGVISWNKGSVELENGSKIMAASTSASAVRGMTFNIIFLDEFAFVPNHIADDFFASVYPTISSGKKTKVIIVSTPKGMNHFYRMWHDAEKGKNSFIPTEVHWSEVPGRDEEWKRQTIDNTSEDQFRAEHLCEFLGSVDTLISPSKLKSLVYESPLTRNAGLDIYEKPQKNHDYLITVDVARGVGKDYSAFTIIDITSFPHRLVGKYRDNQIKPMMFPNFIHEAANAYNKAFILCEVNDVGDQVASILQYDLEYSNILMCSMRGRAGQIVGQGFSGKKTQLGLKMSKTVKKVGCLNLKTLIEEDKLFINDYEVISELTTFIQKHNSFEAEEGCNDDLAVCLVIYAWLVAQDYFKELTNQDIRQKLYDEMENELEQDMAPFGFLSDGLDDNTFIDVDGDRWFLDEYGDTQAEVSYSYMWEYM